MPHRRGDRPWAEEQRDAPWTHGSWAGDHEIPERGQCRFTVPIRSDWPGSNRGAGGGVSGTILAGLVDMAAVKAAQSLWRQGEVYNGTVELNISYIRVATGVYITVDATVLRKGRTMCFVDVDIKDDHERLVAKGRIAYSLSQPEDGSSTADAPFFHPDSFLEKMPFEHADFSADVNFDEPGHCNYRCTIDPEWQRGGLLAGEAGTPARTAARLTQRGGLKGTILAALTDVSTVSAVGTVIEEGEVMQGTVELSISYIRPAAGSCIDATAKVTRKGKGVAFAECTLTDDQERTVASGRIVYSIGRVALASEKAAE